jgi:Protein of unknown function (DUF1488)
MAAEWDVIDNAVWFEITHLGKSMACRIDGATLWEYLGAESPTHPFALRAFNLQSAAIEALAVGKAERGELEPPTRRGNHVVWLRARDVAP